MQLCINNAKYPLFIHGAGQTHNSDTIHQETVNRTEYSVVSDDKIDFLAFDQGDFSDWQSNTIQYYTSPSQKIAWYIYAAGSGKTGSIIGVAEHYKRWSSLVSESLIFDFLHGATDYINGAYVLAPNDEIVSQQKRETVTLYSRKGDYPNSNISITQSYGGTSDTGNEKAITTELGEFYEFNTYKQFMTKYITKVFLSTAYEVQSILHGVSDELRLTRDVVYATIDHPGFIAHCRYVFDNKLLAIDEITNMTPSGSGYKKMINETMYAGMDEIRNLQPKDKYTDNEFIKKMGIYRLSSPSIGGIPEWKTDKEKSNQTSDFRTYFMFFHTIKHGRNMKLILASATPVQNPYKLQSIAGQLNLFSAVLGVDPIRPNTDEILDFVNNYMGGSIGYIARIPSSLPKDYETSLSPLDQLYINEGKRVETNIEAVIIPMGYFQSWKYYILSNMKQNMKSDDTRDKVTIGIMPTSGTRRKASGGYRKLELYHETGYVSGNPTGRGMTGKKAGLKPQQFSVYWGSDLVVNSVKNYFSDIDDLSLYAPKFAYIIQREEGHRLEAQRMFPNTATKFGLGVSVVYCNFVNEVVGLKLLGLTLELQKRDDKDLEYTMFRPTISASVIDDYVYMSNGLVRIKKDKLQKQNRFLLFTSTTPKLMRRLGKRIVQSPDNIDGSYIKMVLLSETGREGITLGNGLRMYHLKSPSLKSHDTQLNARIVRAKVHEDIINAIVQNGDDSSLLKITITRLVSQFYPEMLNGLYVISPEVGSKHVRILSNSNDYYNSQKFYRMWNYFWKGLSRDERSVLTSSDVMAQFTYQEQTMHELEIKHNTVNVIKPVDHVVFNTSRVVGYTSRYITDEIRNQLLMDNTPPDYDAMMDVIKQNTFDLQLNISLNDTTETANVTNVTNATTPIIHRTRRDERYDSIINRDGIASILAAEIILLASSMSYVSYDYLIGHVNAKYSYCRDTINSSLMYLINNRVAQELDTKISYIKLYKGYVYLSTRIDSKPTSLLSLTATSTLVPQESNTLVGYLGMNQAFKNDFLLNRNKNLVSSYSKLSQHDMKDVMESLSYENVYRRDLTRSIERFLHYSRFSVHYMLPDINVLRESDNNWAETTPFSSRLPIKDEVTNRFTRHDTIIAHTFIPVRKTSRLPSKGYNKYVMNVHGLMRLYINRKWVDATKEETLLYKNYILERRREKTYRFERNDEIRLIKSSIIDHKIAKEETSYRLKDPALEDIESSKLDIRSVRSGVNLYSAIITDDMVIKYLWKLNAPIRDEGRSMDEIETDYSSRMLNVEAIFAKHRIEYNPLEVNRHYALLSWLHKDDVRDNYPVTRKHFLKDYMIKAGFLIDWDVFESFL